MGTIARSPRPSGQPTRPKDHGPRPAFTLNEIRILADGSRYLSLYAIWLAAGSPKGREPWRYMNLPDRQGFFDDLARHEGMKASDLIHFNGEHPSDYYGHPQIAIDYAGWINNRFKIAVGNAIREWAEEKVDPDLKVRRAYQAYLDRGFSEERAALRVKSIINRVEFSRTLKDHGVEDDGYAKCTDAINIKVHGGTSRELKTTKKIPKNHSLRDHFDEEELSKTIFAETLASKKIREERAHGNPQCVTACRMAGEAVRVACDFMDRQRINL